MSIETPHLRPPRGCTFSPSDWEVLAKFWHPVAYATDVPAQQPFAARLLDQDLVLYRCDDRVTAAADLCAHRGAPLTLGTMRDGALTCAYHGYRYNGAGRCVLVPAHPGGAIPERLTLRCFGVVERFGIIWVNLTATATTSLPEFPEFDDPAFQIINVPPLDWRAAAGRQIESFCDVAHFAFVHPVTFAVGDPAVPRYEVAATPRGVHADFVSTAGNVSDRAAATQTWRRVYDIHLPFTARLVVHFPQGGRLVILNASCPIAARRTRVFPVVARDFDHASPPDELIAFQQRVYAEDQAIVERQNPEDLPIDLTEEVHVRADRTSIEYRRQLGRLGLGRGFTA